jgi:hypothetical protein
VRRWAIAGADMANIAVGENGGEGPATIQSQNEPDGGRTNQTGGQRTCKYGSFRSSLSCRLTSADSRLSSWAKARSSSC